MKDIIFKPKACIEGDFEGQVKLKIPGFDERYEALDQIGLKVNGEGNIETSDLGSFSSIRKLVSMSQKYYLSVEIKHKDGREFKSFDDLVTEPDCDGILIEIAMNLSRGFKPVKN